MSPDPFLLLGVGSGHETISDVVSIYEQDFNPILPIPSELEAGTLVR